MITKEQFEEWKQLPLTQDFFILIKNNLISNRLNMFDTLTKISDKMDLNKVRDIYASNEAIFNSLLKLDYGDINGALESYKIMAKQYKNELKEVLDVE